MEAPDDLPDATVWTVRVVSPARRDAVDGWMAEAGIGGDQGRVLKIRVAAPARDDRANERLVRFLAERLGVRRGAVRIVAGAHSRTKRIAVAGAPAWDEACRLLGVDPDGAG